MNCFMLELMLVAVGAPVPAPDAAEEVVNKSIVAHGGLEALKKYPALSSDIKGTVTVQGTEIPYTGTLVFQYPDKFRLEIEINLGGAKMTIVQVVNGDKVSQTEDGKNSELTDAVKKELREEAVVQGMTLLYPLIDKSKFTLTSEKDADVNDKPCAVILVHSKKIKDTRLFFDKKTNYLVKTQRQSLSPELEEVDEETVFSDFKEVEGIKVPMKSVVNHDGKPYLTMTMSKYKPLEKADDKLFKNTD